MAQPVKVLFTIPNFMTAGSGQALLHVVRRLNHNDFEPFICVLKTGGALEDEIRALGIPLLELPFTVAARPLASLPQRLWSAAQLFRPFKFDLWHSYHYADDYTEPLIARLAGARAWVYTKKNMSWGGRAWHIRTRLATRVAAQNTTMMRDFFAGTGVQHKVTLLPRGVDTELFQPGLPPRLGVRERLGISAGTMLVGCVAHLVPVKGHETLIHAVAALPDVHLVLAGKPIDQDYADRLKRLCGDLEISDRVHFWGNVTDVAAFNTELDVFVLPTLGRMRMEGCPVALLEAMACGLPCIATNIPGSNDIIVDEQSGLLVPPEDVNTLTQALRRLRDQADLRLKLGQNARQRVCMDYAILREVAQHEALYASALRRSPMLTP